METGDDHQPKSKDDGVKSEQEVARAHPQGGEVETTPHAVITHVTYQYINESGSTLFFLI